MSNLYPTPHIKAKPGDFGKTVLMPGDPLRAKYIAEHYLENAVLVNNVRYVQGYTGTYNGMKISVMASGMGMPSMGIYSYELFTIFDVDNIIRIGSAGSIKKDIKIRDIVIGMGACTDSNFVHQYNIPGHYSNICSYNILQKCTKTADDMKIRYHVGNLVSSDCFYSDDEGIPESLRSVHAWSKMGVMAVEMEAAALYMNAARAGKNAIALCTISDHLLSGEKITAEERQSSFTEMMELALNSAKNFDEVLI